MPIDRNLPLNHLWSLLRSLHSTLDQDLLDWIAIPFLGCYLRMGLGATVGLRCHLAISFCYFYEDGLAAWRVLVQLVQCNLCCGAMALPGNPLQAMQGSVGRRLRPLCLRARSISPGPDP